MKPAVFAPAARRDLRDAASWIAKDNPAAARAFRESVTASAIRIGRHPGVGSARPELADERIRFLVLPGFPYLLVYASDTTPPRVLRVLHGARDIPAVLAGLPPPS